MLNYDFKDKVVLITGAGSGIGEECAKEFSKAGATVVLCDNKEERIRKVKEEITNNGGKALGCKVDVTDYHMIEKLIDFTVEKLGKIDVVVNSAGICKLIPIDEMPIETVDALIDINLKGTVYMCKALTPIMKKQQSGKIINMASIAGRICNSGFKVLSAVSKNWDIWRPIAINYFFSISWVKFSCFFAFLLILEYILDRIICCRDYGLYHLAVKDGFFFLGRS